jgi:hypothetical protein
MLVVVLVVDTLLAVPIHQGPGAMVVVGMEAIVLSTQQVVTQHLTLVEVVVLETIRPVIQKAEKAVLAS